MINITMNMAFVKVIMALLGIKYIYFILFYNILQQYINFVTTFIAHKATMFALFHHQNLTSYTFLLNKSLLTTNTLTEDEISDRISIL